MQFHILANYDHATIDKIRNVGKCENLEKTLLRIQKQNEFSTD